MDQLLSHWLKIRPEERRQTALLFLLLFFATSFIIIGRTARDALFLARTDAGGIALMYIGIGVASSLMVLVYNRAISRWTPDRLLVSALSAIAGCVLILRLLIALEWPPVYPILYIFHEMAGGLLAVLFWTYANEAFTTREAKRLFNIIGSGSVMAGTVCGFGGAWLAPLIGTRNLLVLCVAALLGALFIMLRVRKLPRHRLASERLPGETPQTRLQAGARSYGRAFAGIAVVMAICVSIVDYQFKVLTQQHYDEAGLAVIFGVLYGSAGLLSFIFHLSFTSRLLSRVGILPALLVLPGALILGAGGMILMPSLAVAVFSKAADASLRYSLNETCFQLLYLPLPVHGRRRLKAWLEGSLKPASIGLMGVLFYLVGSDVEALQALAILLSVGLVLWILLAFRLEEGYVSALVASVSHRTILEADAEISVSDVASRQALLEALRSDDDGVVMSALELLPTERGFDWGPWLLPLLSRSNRELALAALASCEAEDIQPTPDDLRPWLSDPRPDIRAASLSHMPPDVVEQYLDDHEPMVRYTAVVILTLDSRDAAPPRARDVLDSGIIDDDPVVRRWTAWAVGELSGPDVWLRRLLADPDLEVQAVALEAAAKARSLALAPLIIEHMKRPEIGSEAASALVRYGEMVLAQLLAHWPPAADQDELRVNMFSALRGIGTRRVAEELIRRLPKERALRQETLLLTSQIIRNRDEGGLRLDQVYGPLIVEVQDCYQWWAILHALGPSDPWELLRVAVREECVLARERALLLLAHVYPAIPVQAFSCAFPSASRRRLSNAIEAVEQMMAGELKRHILPLLEDIPLSERVQIGRSFFPLAELNSTGWLRYFVRSEDRWFRLCALHTVGHLLDQTLIADVRELLKSNDPATREAALIALSRISSRTEQARLWARHCDDADPRISRLAIHVFKGQEKEVISSVDKVLFLKRVDLFSTLSGRELMHLATIADQVVYQEGTIIFEEGAEGTSLYVILSGKVDVTRDGQRLGILGPRECFGEMTILDSEPRSATVCALDEVAVLCIEQESFYDLLAHSREIALGIIRILVRRLRSTMAATSRARVAAPVGSHSKDEWETDSLES